MAKAQNKEKPEEDKKRTRQTLWDLLGISADIIQI